MIVTVSSIAADTSIWNLFLLHNTQPLLGCNDVLMCSMFQLLSHHQGHTPFVEKNWKKYW